MVAAGKVKHIFVVIAILATLYLLDAVATCFAVAAIDYYKENISASYCASRHKTCSFSNETCSQYAKHAIQEYGFFIGGCKAYKRLFDCAQVGRQHAASASF